MCDPLVLVIHLQLVLVLSILHFFLANKKRYILRYTVEDGGK